MPLTNILDSAEQIKINGPQERKRISSPRAKHPRMPFNVCVSDKGGRYGSDGACLFAEQNSDN